jgi:hypothetical protein
VGLKDRLIEARRSSSITLSDNDKTLYRKLIKEGISKKTLCVICGVGYKELKRLIK